jgi:site-specific DNA-methyltransferase (adenine-specific)
MDSRGIRGDSFSNYFYSMEKATVISEVFNMDCIQAMKGHPDKFFDLALVDPPFGIGTVKNKFQLNKNTHTYKNKETHGPEYFFELERVSKASIIWGCQYYLEQLNPDGSFIVWDKKADPDLHNMSSCDVAWYSKRDRIRTFKGAWCGAVKCESEPTIHIHQKPVSLYKWLLKHYAQPGYRILDTHMGSQSSRIAAYDMGFDYTGFEIDREYFFTGNRRFEQFKSQIKIFQA